MIIVKTTSDSKNALKRIAFKLLNNKLASCINILEGVNSMYSWRGKIVEEKEHIMLIKTLKIKELKVYKLIKMYHNYELPELVTLNVNNVDKTYLRWIKDSIEND